MIGQNFEDTTSYQDFTEHNTTEVVSIRPNFESEEEIEIIPPSTDLEEYKEETDDKFVQLMEEQHGLTDSFLVGKVKEGCSATKITREGDVVEDYPTILENVKLAFKLKGRLTENKKDIGNVLNINAIYIQQK